MYRLATELGLTGCVCNSPAGVTLELQGQPEVLDVFQQRLQAKLPPLASISRIKVFEQPLLPDEADFRILPSSHGLSDIQIAPDTATCPDCLQELSDATNRRYQHPFITCTNCGPRWTIVTGIPYDRPLTTMADFPLCKTCQGEYDNPLDRRFHAQPIACPECGPVLSLQPEHPEPLEQAVHLLQQGQIVAIKGLGGFHLAVDACNDAAVKLLRQRKQRDEKPFAIMVQDLATARQLAVLSADEERLLSGPEAPILIAQAKPGSQISKLVAPGSSWLGLILAYSPLHHLLFGKGNFTALVMTSANRSDEPMIADDLEAAARLHNICTAILGHNRPIQTRSDDSVIRILQGSPLFYRRSRGYVPRAVPLPFNAYGILGLGAEFKNTICLTKGQQAFLSQHIGDLKNSATYDVFQQTIQHLGSMLEIKPQLLVCDLHPDYLSSHYAAQSGLPTMQVQHHHAHLAACMAENQLDGELIGLILDGTGLGDDGSIWGGEFLVGGYSNCQRMGHLKPVRLPGGDAAAREPWRMALAWLHQPMGDDFWRLPALPAFEDDQKKLLVAMLQQGINSPLTSSAGRLFDAASFLLGEASRNSFDGQAAMKLEALAEQGSKLLELPWQMIDSPVFQLDFTDTLLALTDKVRQGLNKADLALSFHATLAAALVTGCKQIRYKSGLDRVALSGGVFQNRLLTELVYTELQQAGFTVYLHRLVPPNDGGIALGQVAIAANRREKQHVSGSTNAGGRAA